MTRPLQVLDQGTLLSFGLDDLARTARRSAGRSVWTRRSPGGARDAVELVTRAVTEDRSVTVIVREGFVTDGFIALSRTPDRTAEQEAHLTDLQQDMADLLLAVPADKVYDVVVG